ncbi:MAG: PAS domain S-box protein, partial [Desulfuromonadaceae bacterium]|nr:PAS domain S-box protein [Desulfuromonadaceae bacterium]
MKILLCCDDSTLISRLKTELHNQGHTVLHFEHTETVHLPDGPLLIILDSDDAQGDVLAAIQHRKNQRPDQPPIRTILLISQGAPINIEEGVDAGCDDFLLRPFTPIELSVRIKFNLHLLEKQSQPGLSDKGLVFENAPVSLWQEDFSALKKRIEQLRAEGIEDFRQYFRTHPEVVAECATLVKVLNVNRKSLELHRANSKAELLVGLANTFTEESFAVFREELIGLTEGKKHFRSEAVVKTLDGEKRDVIVQFFVEPDSRDWSQVYLALTDITEQKKFEDTLQSSESRLRSILRVAPTGIALVIDRVLQASNQKLCEIVGYSREELIGQSVSMFYRTNEDYESVSREQYRQIDLYGTGTIETRWQCKDGTIIDVLLCSTPLNATDLSEGVTCTILDMTARKRAERALRDSEENLRTILHSIGDAVIATDTQQRVIKLNPIAEQLTGWDASEATGRNLKEVFNIINAETGLQAEDIVGKALTSGKIVRLSNQAILRSKEGKQYPIADSAAPIKDAGGNTNGAVLVFRDMTEELRTREELQRMQTLESIGILAGGIAHDFNNILMGLFGNIAMAKRKISPDHPSYKNLQNAENSADRAKNLTGKLLTFAKGGEPIRDHVSLA